MKKSIASITALFMSVTSVVPAFALSQAECAALKQEIDNYRNFIRTGGMSTSRGTDGGLATARAAEAAARDEMVANRCNLKANAGTPMCIQLIARVKSASAAVKDATPRLQGNRDAAANAELASMTGRYSAECGPGSAQRQARETQRQQQQAADGAAIGLGVAGALLGGGFGGGRGGGGGGGGMGGGGGGGRGPSGGGMTHPSR